MKFLHAADLHLDSPLRGLDALEGAPAERIRGATRKALDALVELAIEEEVSFVLLAGDLYDGSWRDVNTAIFLARRIGDLDRAGIRVFGVLGNHDAESKLSEGLDRPRNLTIFSSKAPETVTLEELGVAIHGQSFGSRRVETNLALGFPARVPGLLNVGLLHTSLDGREGHADYAPCSVEDLRSKGYDYWALGHVHKREVVAQDPWIVFPGCLQGRHARETGPKGATLVTCSGGHVESIEERALGVVRWEHLELDVSECRDVEEVFDAVLGATGELRDRIDEPLLVSRVRLVGRTPLHASLRGHRALGDALHGDALHGDARRLRARLVERLVERFGDGVWLEALQIETAPPIDRDATRALEGPLGELIRSIDAIAADGAELAGLDALVAPLASRLAAIAREHPELDLERPERRAQLVEGAKRLLVERLVDVEEGP